jgi:hypothetical protein
MDDKTVLLWAAQEIRDLDELCRSQVAGFEPLNSAEMEFLKRLEKLATGSKEAAYPDLREELKDARARVEYLEEMLGLVRGAVAQADGHP